MDVGTINQILNIVLIVTFVVVIVGLVAAILIGLKKKVIKSTYTLIFMLTLTIVAICLVGVVSDAITNVNLVPMLGQTREITSGGKTGVVVIGTVKETLNNFFVTLCNLNGIAITYDILTKINQLSIVIIKYIALLLELIIVAIIGYLLSVLLWHCLFKHLIPKVLRKVKKLRWLACIENGLSFFIVGGLIVASFSSLLNTVDNAWKKASKDLATCEIVNNINTLTATYENSIWGKLFSWTADSNGVTLDSKLINNFISVTIDDYSVSLYSLLDELADIAAPMAKGFTFGSNVIVNIGYLTTTATVSSVFDNMNKSRLISDILPMGLEMIMNSKFLEQYLNREMIDVEGADWKYEYQKLQDTILTLTDSDLVNYLFPGGTIDSMIKFKAEGFITECLKDKNYLPLKAATNYFDQSQVLSSVLDAALSHLISTTPDFRKYVNLTDEEIKEISWTDEFDILLSGFYDVNKDIPTFVHTLFDTMENPPSSAKDNKLTKLIAENMDAFKSSFIGERDASGKLINIDDEGYSIEGSVLMDSTVMMNLIPNLKETFVEAIKAVEIGSIKLDAEALGAAYDNLSVGKKVKNFKEEFNVLFDILQDVMLDPSLFEIDFQHLENVPDEQLEQVADIVACFDFSKLLSSIAPSFADGVFSIKEIKDGLNYVGLQTSDLDLRPIDEFGNSTICYELAHIIRNIKPIFNLINSVKGTPDLSKIAKEYKTVAEALDTIFLSNIINPSKKFYDGDADNNYFTILKKVFGDGTNPGLLKIQGMYFNPTVSDLHPVSHGLGNHEWANSYTLEGEVILDGENGALALCLCQAGKDIYVSGSSTPTNIFKLADSHFDFGAQIKVLESDEEDEFRMSALLAQVDCSTVFSRCMGDFLDNAMATTGLLDIDNGITFNNIQDWNKEGQALRNVILSADDLGINLSKLDITKIEDPVKLNRLLHDLADSSLFITPDTPSEYLFNLFLYQKMKTVFVTNTNNYLCDPGTQSNPTYEHALNDFELEETLVGYDSTAIKTNWYSPNYDRSSESLFVDDNIGKVSNFLKVMNEEKAITEARTGKTYADLFAFIKSGDIKGEQYGHMLTAANESSQLTMIMYHALDDFLKDFKFEINLGSEKRYISLAKANTDYLVKSTTTKAMRQDEINVIVDLFITIEHLKDNTAEISIDEMIKHPEAIILLDQTLIDLNQSNLTHISGSKDPTETSVFQDVVSAFLNVKTIKDVNYSASSVKDIYHTLKGDYTAETKGDYIVSNFFKFGDDYNKNTQAKHIHDLSEAISSLCAGYNDLSNLRIEYDSLGKTSKVYKANDPSKAAITTYYPGIRDNEGHVITDFSTMKIEYLNSLDTELTLLTINGSDVLCDAIPGALDKIFDAINSGIFNKVDFSNSNPYYIFEDSYGDFDPTKENAKIDSNEISTLSYLIDDVKDIINIDFKKISSLSDLEYFELADTIESIADTFYASKSLNSMVTYKLVDSSTEVSPFESLIKAYYVEPGLSKASYNSDNHMDVTTYGSAENKLHALVKNTSKNDIARAIDPSYINPVGYNTTWDEEVSSLKEVFINAKPLLDTLGEGKSFEDIVLDIENPTLSPDYVVTLFSSLNHCDCIEGSVAHNIKLMMSGIGFNQLSTYNSIDRASYFLTQKEYGYHDQEMNNIYALLDAFSLKDGSGTHKSYFKISGTISYDEFALKGVKASSIIRFGYNSALYNSYLASGNNIHVYSIFEYNIFKKANLDTYFLGSTSLDKIQTFEKLLGFTSDIENECTSFDTLFSVSKDILNVPSFTDIKDLKNIKLPIYKAMASTTNLVTLDNTLYEDYIVPNSEHARSYLTSEMIASMLQKFIDDEITNYVSSYDFRSIEPTFASLRVGSINPIAVSNIEITSSSYDLISLGEARGIYGMLSLYKENFIEYTTFTRNDPSFASLGFENCFEYMDKGTSNSQVALAVYANRVFDNASILPGAPTTTVSDLHLYNVTNRGDFKNYGIKLADALGL